MRYWPRPNCRIDRCGDIDNDAAAIFHIDIEVNGKFRGDVLIPAEVHHLLRVITQITDIAAIFGVHHQTSARTDMTYDRVTRDRATTLGEIHHQTFGTVNRQWR